VLRCHNRQGLWVAAFAGTTGGWVTAHPLISAIFRLSAACRGSGIAAARACLIVTNPSVNATIPYTAFSDGSQRSHQDLIDLWENKSANSKL
jgi:hypothetical protein